MPPLAGHPSVPQRWLPAEESERLVKHTRDDRELCMIYEYIRRQGSVRSGMTATLRESARSWPPALPNPSAQTICTCSVDVSFIHAFSSAV